MIISEKEIQRFIEINDKIRLAEIRARKHYLNLISELNKLVANKTICDFEIDEQYSLFSFNEVYCKTKNIEIGDPFFVEKCFSMKSDEEFFNTNWNEYRNSNQNPLKDLHFGYTMHSLLFHNNLELTDILAIDDFWLELIVRHQFFTNLEVL